MKIIRTVSSLTDTIAQLKAQGKTIGLVPTMGALHDGHLSLVKRAIKECDATVVSVFVNPTQFNNSDDLRTYPRTEQADAALLEQAGADFAFMPTVDEVYPQGTQPTRHFDLGSVAQVMEGAMRPGHFDGVAQVVSRLFDIVAPHKAYFGEKDFQQIAVIRRMVKEGGYDIEIIDCPICRHTDGLAMSSRNVRLTSEQRAVAPNIHAVLKASIEKAKSMSLPQLKQWVVDAINASSEWLDVEYYEIVDPITMQPLSQWPQNADAVGCITVYCGEVRLIDNIKYHPTR